MKNNWQKVKLGDVVLISKGKKVSFFSSPIANSNRFIQIDDLRNNNNLKYTLDKGVVVNRNDIIIAWDGANAGTIGYGLNGIIGSTLAKLEIKTANIYPSYLGKFLNSKFDYLRKNTTGATIPHISRDSLLKLEIQIPHLSEQKRIVKILDEADSLIQKRKKAIELLDEYLKSVFFKMFGDPVKNPKGWKVVRLEEVCTKITDGTHKTPKYTTEGIKFISAKNIKGEGIIWDNVKYISKIEHQLIYKRCNPELNDLLLTKSGSLGMVALVDVNFEFSLFESLALLKVIRELVEPIFLREYLNLEGIKSYYSQRTKGIGVKHLHLIDIKSIPIILPSNNIQFKFVQKVKKIKSNKQKMLIQSQELETQFQVLMQEAFKGEI